MEFVINETKTCFMNGVFIRQFYWNTSAIIGNSGVKSGFIVQHIVRDTKDSLSLYAHNEDYNHSYWEAWPVKDGRITLEDYGFNDRWTNVPCDWDMYTYKYRRKWLLEKLAERNKSIGMIRVHGQVFWAPHGDELETIVHESFRKKAVRWAWDLQATEDIEASSRFIPMFEHEFQNGWSLLNNEDYIRAEQEITEWGIQE